MYTSLALIQFKSISVGYFSLDKILKTLPVEILKITNVCPGALFIVLSGVESDILSCKQICENINCHFQKIDNVNENVIDLIKHRHNKIPTYKNVAIIETTKCIDAFKIADLCLKNNSIEVFRLDYMLGLFGKGVLFLSGNLSELNSSVDKIKQSIKDKKILNISIIPAADSCIFKK